MESFVNDMLEQKLKREAPLPTKEDMLAQAVKDLRAMLPKNPQLASKKVNEKESVKEERECLLRAIVAKAVKGHPEQDTDFINHIPEMHFSWPALISICKHPALLEIYAKVISDIYKSAHTIEHEHIWFALDCDSLIYELSENGMVWTEHSQRKIEKLYPKLYHRLYAEEHPMGFFV